MLFYLTLRLYAGSNKLCEVDNIVLVDVLPGATNNRSNEVLEKRRCYRRSKVVVARTTLRKISIRSPSE